MTNQALAFPLFAPATSRHGGSYSVLPVGQTGSFRVLGSQGSHVHTEFQALQTEVQYA